MLAQEQHELTVLAKEIGYEGTLTIGALEDEIRFYQRRTVEALLECGKRLVLLKKMTPHGEFAQRVEMLGFAERTAQRFMQAAQKVSRSANLAVLSNQVKSASAFLELVTHDDDALESLKDMDDIDRMSASELRSTLRQAKEDNKFLAEKRDKEQQRADNAEKALKSGGPKARSLEARVADFSKDVDAEQEAATNALLAMDQQVKALDSWYLEYAAQQSACLARAPLLSQWNKAAGTFPTTPLQLDFGRRKRSLMTLAKAGPRQRSWASRSSRLLPIVSALMMLSWRLQHEEH